MGPEEHSLGSSYRRLWSAATISNVGDGMFYAALPLLAITLTTDPLSLSAVTFSLTLPWLLFALISGALVDRCDRITMMWRVDLARFVVTAGLTAVIVSDHLSIPILVTFGFALGSAETLFDTASLSVVPSIVGTKQDRLTRANARLDTASILANGFVGPAAGANLFAIVPPLPAVANAISFLFSAILLRQIPHNSSAASSVRTSIRIEITEGLKWLRGQSLIATLAVAVGVINLCTVAATTVLVLFLQQRAHVGPLGYSLVLIAAATGGVLGNIFAEKYAAGWPMNQVLPTTVAVTGIALVTVGIISTVGIVAVAFAAIGFAGAVWNIQTVSFRQRIIPTELLGRVNSVYRLIAYGTLPIGAISGGLLAQAINLGAPFLINGVLLLLSACLLAVRLRTP
jgi:MFS family permease